ncbi:MAG: hypothetical protein ACI9FR_002724 [Cryomorphaceae bacterium]
MSLIRRGKRFVKNFPDKKCGSKDGAYRQALEFRDQLLTKYPPISRKEFCNAQRRNNKTGITGVYKYAKSYRLKDGTLKESWYWEANWPDANSESVTVCFPVKKYGDEFAKQMAIRARKNGLLTVKGIYWAAERGEVQVVSPIVEVPIALNA